MGRISLGLGHFNIEYYAYCDLCVYHRRRFRILVFTIL